MRVGSGTCHELQGSGTCHEHAALWLHVCVEPPPFFPSTRPAPRQRTSPYSWSTPAPATRCLASTPSTGRPSTSQVGVLGGGALTSLGWIGVLHAATGRRTRYAAASTAALCPPPPPPSPLLHVHPPICRVCPARRDELCWPRVRLLPPRPPRKRGGLRAADAVHVPLARRGIQAHQEPAGWVPGVVDEGQRPRASVLVRQVLACTRHPACKALPAAPLPSTPQTHAACRRRPRGGLTPCALSSLPFTRAGHHAKVLPVLRVPTPAPAGGESAQVGIVWNYFWFEPKRSKWCTPFYLPWVRRVGGLGVLWAWCLPACLHCTSCGLERRKSRHRRAAASGCTPWVPPAPLLAPPLPCSRVLNRLWGNDMFMTYMETGVFEWDPLPWCALPLVLGGARCCSCCCCHHCRHCLLPAAAVVHAAVGLMPSRASHRPQPQLPPRSSAVRVFSRVAARDPKPGCDFLGLNYYSRVGGHQACCTRARTHNAGGGARTGPRS